MRHRDDIEALRALAIVLVLLFHALPWAMPGGFLGVDVFFVVSGYLITSLLAREHEATGRISKRSFLARRILRLGPALCVTLAATLAAGWFWLQPDDYAATGRTAAAAAFGIANIELGWSHNYFAPVLQNALTHTWSLGVEEQFYLAWLLVLALAAARGAGRLSWTAAAVAAAVGGFAWAVHVQHTDPEWAFYRPDVRAWEMAAGAALALLHGRRLDNETEPRSARGRRNLLLFWASAAAIVLACLLWTGTLPHPGWGTLPVVLATLAALHAGRDVQPLPPRSRAGAAVARCGAMSYALYLVHWPLFVGWWSITDRPFGLGEAAAALVLAATAAWALHRWVEIPLRRPPPDKVRPTVLATLLGLACVAWAGYGVHAAQGGAYRVPEEVRRLTAYDTRPLAALQPCQFNGARTWRPEDLPRCVIGPGGPAEATPSWALWGDSHASTLASGLTLDTRTPPFLGLLASACPPMTTLTVRRRPQCHLFGAQALETLRATPSVRTVVLHARWSWYGRGGANGLMDARGHRTEATVFDETDRTIRALQEAGYEVVLVGPVPEQETSVPRSILRQAWQGTARPEIGLARDAYDRQQARALAWLAAWEARGLRVVRPDAAFCDQSRCRGQAEDGQILYFDSNHLTPEGAARITGPLLSEIARAVARAP